MATESDEDTRQYDYPAEDFVHRAHVGEVCRGPTIHALLGCLSLRRGPTESIIGTCREGGVAEEAEEAPGCMSGGQLRPASDAGMEER